MKLALPFSGRESCRAFTLAEQLVTMAVLGMVSAALMSTHFFGLRMYEMTKAKVGASDEARGAIGKLVNEIRTGKLIKIGTGGLSSFTEVPIDTPQKGNAVQIYPTTNTTSFIRYYWDSSDRKLKRTVDGSTSVYVVANSVSNQLVFTSEDFQGKILTNNANNRVIGLTLQFYQLQYPLVAIGPGQYYDFYQLRSKITRRTLE